MFQVFKIESVKAYRMLANIIDPSESSFWDRERIRAKSLAQYLAHYAQ